MKDSSIYNVRVIERAMQVLSCFDGERPEMTLTEIARAVHLSPATALRILTTLQGGGYVDRPANSDRYRLGLRVVEMGFGAVRRLDIRRLAKQRMIMLERQFQETCDLSVFNRGEMLCVEVVLSRRTLSIAGSPGYRSPMHATASGKVFLADLTPEELAPLLSSPLQRYTEKTITDPDALQEHLAEVRARGYATDDEELSAGVRAVAAPVRGRDRRVAGVIGMPGPLERMGEERVREIADALVAAANEVSASMG
jgi:DNA-binding IclR family transcriptional regulator